MNQDLKTDERELIERALERVEKGLAPPSEIYRVEIRPLIDWSRFPRWAQPVDPEMFDGGCHEG